VEKDGEKKEVRSQKLEFWLLTSGSTADLKGPLYVFNGGPEGPLYVCNGT
jgi:hypothetical protein